MTGGLPVTFARLPRRSNVRAWRPDQLAEQAALMESYGAHVVYVVDSAGALIPDRPRSVLPRSRAKLECEVGFHAHNLGCAVGNSLAAAAEGATWIDGSLCGLGAGAGNAQIEVLAPALDRAGYEHSVDFFQLSDVAEEVMGPRIPGPQKIDPVALALGYAGSIRVFPSLRASGAQVQSA